MDESLLNQALQEELERERESRQPKNVKKDVVVMILILLGLTSFFVLFLVLAAMFFQRRFPEFEDNLRKELSILSQMIEGSKKSGVEKRVNELMESADEQLDDLYSSTPAPVPSETVESSENLGNTEEKSASIGICKSCGEEQCGEIVYKDEIFDIDGCYTMEDYYSLNTYLGNYESLKERLLYYAQFYDENGCTHKDKSTCFLSVKDRMIQLKNDIVFYINEINKITSER